MGDPFVTIKTVGFEEFISRLQAYGPRAHEVLEGWFMREYGPYIRDEVKAQIPASRSGGRFPPGSLRSSIRVQKWRGRWVVGPTRRFVVLGSWFESGTGAHIINPRARTNTSSGHKPRAGMLIGGTSWASEVHHPGAQAHGTMQRTVEASEATGARMLANYTDEMWLRRIAGH